jgi:preprotein translocase subunit SecG
MLIYLNVAQIIVCVALIGLILLQTRNSGLGSSFGGDSIFRTRRGLDRTLFQLTIVLSIIFSVLSLLSVFAS